ncbi:MAG: LPS assembly lipoprotein LptE [Candidatus Omnitrophota bacterium]
MKKVVILIFLLVSGCGYTTKGFFYKEDKILIRPVVNKISIASEDRMYSSEDRMYSSQVYYPILIEKKFSNALINKFNVDGRLKVVSAQKENSLKLECEIIAYRKEGLRYTSADEVEEQKLYLDVHMTLYDSDEEIFIDRNVTGDTSYYLTGSNAKSETAAQTDLIDDTAKRILEVIVENW